MESSITCLVSGTAARPLFDRFRLSREKLAYLTDSTSAPVCILIPMNGWGMLVIGILGTLGIEDGVSLLVASIPFNFYSLAALGLAFWFGLSGRDFGPMARAQHRARETGQVIRKGARPLVSTEVLAVAPAPGAPERARNMVLPLAVLLAMIFVGLWITGEGDLLAGDGGVSVLWAVLAAGDGRRRPRDRPAGAPALGERGSGAPGRRRDGAGGHRAAARLRDFRGWRATSARASIWLRWRRRRCRSGSFRRCSSS